MGKNWFFSSERWRVPNIHNLDFRGIELGSYGTLSAPDFHPKRRGHQRTHGNYFLVFCELVVGFVVVVVGLCGGCLDGWKLRVWGHTQVTIFPRARAL